MRVGTKRFAPSIYNAELPQMDRTQRHQYNNNIAGQEYIEAEYVEVSESESGAEIQPEVQFAANQNQSQFVRADKTSYARYNEITSYNHEAAFFKDLEDYNNPYTDSELNRYKRMMLA